jgi:heptaprenyl diphosphate synthase
VSARDWLADALVRRQLEDVEALIARTASRGERIPAFHRQLVSRRSKRLRSALLLLAARFGDAIDESPLLSAAAGIELLHEATLYHDDIVDTAAQRRGEPTVQRAHGPSVAAFAGSELLYATAEHWIDLPPRLRRSVGRVGDALCRGQYREVEAIGDATLSVRHRLRIMRDKTASLFGLGARIGAGLAGVPEDIGQPLIRFGRLFGMCFQLADDLRDLVSTSAELGREPGADLRDGVYTLPILCAIDADGSEAGELRAALRALWLDPTSGMTARARALLWRTGGIDRAVAMLDQWLGSARTLLSLVDAAAAAEARASLNALLDRLQIDLRPDLPRRPAQVAAHV